MALKKAGGSSYLYSIDKEILSSFTSDSSGQLNVLWHDGDDIHLIIKCISKMILNQILIQYHSMINIPKNKLNIEKWENN